MAHYANQKTIIIHRSNPIGEKKQYLAIDCQALSTAARTLTPSGLKLFLYLASNQDGYQKTFPISMAFLWTPREKPAQIYNLMVILQRMKMENLSFMSSRAKNQNLQQRKKEENSK